MASFSIKKFPTEDDSSSQNFYYNQKIYSVINSLKNVEESKTPTLLYQSNFDTGTYRITKPGLYKLAEDISFNPNPGTFDANTMKFIGPNNWNPLPNQINQYPFLPYHLGFFAAITVEADNVVIDLNGKTLCQSNEHYLQQRFFACIEIANQPFIPNQGPANFGLQFFAPTNVKIKNGYIGMSSHHGIHGNGMQNIILENLIVYNFEIAGIALNGGANVLFKNIQVYNTNINVPVMATYSMSRFIRPFLIQIKDTTNPNIILAGLNVNATILLDNIDTEMNTVYNDFIVNKNSYISSNFYRNDKKVADGSVYGILLNQKGVAVGPFLTERKNEPNNNENIILDNVSIKDLSSDPKEIIGISPEITTINYGVVEQVGPVGDVLRIQEITNPDGTYKPNVLSQSQMYIASVSGTAGTTNITPYIFSSWASTSTVNLQTIMDQRGYYYVNGGDSMAHAMKGTIGLFLSGIKSLNTHNVTISNIQNTGDESLSTTTTKLYDGNVSRGIAVASCIDSKINARVSGISSRTSCCIGVDIIGKSNNIVVKTDLTTIQSSCFEYPSPNRKPFVKLVQLSDTSTNIQII